MLGDRPIEITLQRAWDALSWRRRRELAAALAAGALSVQRQAIDAAAIERLKEDDAVSLLFAQLSEAYPEVGCVAGERCNRVVTQAAGAVRAPRLHVPAAWLALLPTLQARGSAPALDA